MATTSRRATSLVDAPPGAPVRIQEVVFGVVRRHLAEHGLEAGHTVTLCRVTDDAVELEGPDGEVLRLDPELAAFVQVRRPGRSRLSSC